ncbi:phage integrase N-terminal domain-containing protein [Paenibacillus sp. R14(2021)]|uniref:phage integrase N-terminal domain-containing protein n=1 Tax=Paenibacillus sp. R14(2021) TaxID=2859228 RepID=UPI001C614300|nr:phage integrase N-terminal domain-containing protein [Paenibacillus sp. R14(2021)]
MGKSTIEVQLDICFRHSKRNSYLSRKRYFGSCKPFISYLEDEFRLQNLRNLHDKHVVAYITERQKQGISAKTILNDLCAIRYLHDLIQNPRYELSDNRTLQEKYGLVLDIAPVVNGDRSWTNEEFNRMLDLAIELNREDIKDAMTLAKELGLRVTEVIAMSRAQVEKALRTRVYTVKGEAKNGKHRNVPLSFTAERIMRKLMQLTPRGGKVFVEKGEKVHHVSNRVQQFIIYHREKIVTPEGELRRSDRRYGTPRELTMHGLRYNYVQERFEAELSIEGVTELDAALKITKEIGHNRINVLKVYKGG